MGNASPLRRELGAGHVARKGAGRAMSAEGNKAVVRKFFEECWNNGNLAFLDECMEPEVAYNEEPHVTRERWRDGIARWRTAFPDCRYHVGHLVGEGDIVAASTRFIATHRGVFHHDNW